MTETFIRLTGPEVKAPRNILLSDAHGRIIFANFMTPRIDGKTRYYSKLSCGVMRIYYSDCLENIHRLLREDERKNDRLFDEAKRALEEINTGQEYVMQRHHAQGVRA